MNLFAKLTIVCEPVAFKCKGIMSPTTVTTRKVTTDEEPPQIDRSDRPYLVLFQFFDFIFLLIEGLLLTRFILRATGANPAAGFVQFVYGISDIFMAPFRLIFPASAAGGFVVEWSVLLAMLVYGLIYYLIRKVISMAYVAE